MRVPFLRLLCSSAAFALCFACGAELEQPGDDAEIATARQESPAAQPDAAARTAASAAALTQLRSYLATPRAGRASVAAQPFARVALTRADAATAKQLLWDDFARDVRATRASEVGATTTIARTIPGANGLSLKYYLARRGAEPPGGRSLFISMHGGGQATRAQNDSQWRNQISLVTGYNPKDAVWVAPRAPVDAWNMWFVEGIDALLERLITDMIVFERINPNKVYLTGYSAGGDGVYQLGPRMAERWAGAGMSAGHPNASSPLSLRNVAFAIHVGGADTAFERNKKGEEWGRRLEQLAAADPGGYVSQWRVHPGLPHWMNLADAVSIPFLQSKTRNPYPTRVVWEQAEVPRAHSYWLYVDPEYRAHKNEIRARFAPGVVTIESAKGVRKLTVRLADEMFDLDQSVRIEHSGRTLFAGSVARTIGVIAKTLGERNDPTMVFSSEVTVQVQ